MKLDREEYHVTSLQEEILKTTYRMERVLPFIKREGEKTIYWDLLKYLFDRYHSLKSIKNKSIMEETPVYNTTLDYIVEKNSDLSNKSTCSLVNIRNSISSTQL